MNLKEKTIWAAGQKIILKIQFLTGDRCEIYGPTIGFFSNSASWGPLDTAPYIHAGKGGYLNFILLPLSAKTDLSNTVGF